MLFSTKITTRRGHPRFTVLQLNTLGKFDEPLDVVLKRQETLLSYINVLRPSILSLQEVPGSNSETGLDGAGLNIPDTLLTLGHDYKYVGFEKETKRADMAVVVYDSALFELVHAERFRFSTKSQSPMSQFAIITILRIKGTLSTSPTAGCILFIGQHAKAGRDNECESIRIDHSRQLFEYLSNPRLRHDEEASHDSIELFPTLLKEGRFIWAGDMNAGPKDYGEENNWPCEWYRRVVKGLPPSNSSGESDDWYNKAIPLLSSMTIAHHGEEPPFTTYKVRNGRLISQTIDYIFVSKGSQRLLVTGVTSPASAFCLGENNTTHGKPRPPIEGFPNDDWGSDHLPLLCEFEFRELTSHTVPENIRCEK